MDNLDIQKVMDDDGISGAQYSNIFKVMKSKLKEKKISSEAIRSCGCGCVCDGGDDTAYWWTHKLQ